MNNINVKSHLSNKRILASLFFLLLVRKVGLRIIIATGIGARLPNKTPIFLLPWLEDIDRKSLSLGLANIIIAKK